MTLPPVLSGPLTVPVMAAPMFIASGPELVVAQCGAGIIGSFPALNARPSSLLRDWVSQIVEETAALDNAAPFAVNLVVHRTNDRLDSDLETLVDLQVPIVITSLGVRADVNEAIHSYGGLVLHDAINDRFARKAINTGADGLIAVAAGAGGHGGTLSPFALVQEIRQWFDGPLLLSGSIAHGRSVLAAQVLGADLSYIGSAFLATHEANAVDRYKDLIVDSSAADIVYSDSFTGIHGNYLRGSITEAGLDPDRLPPSDPSAMNFATRGNDAKAWRDIWGSGQGIGVVRRRGSTAELVERLRLEYEEAVSDLGISRRVDCCCDFGRGATP